MTGSPWATSRARALDLALTAALLSLVQIVPLAVRRVRPSSSFALV